MIQSISLCTQGYYNPDAITTSVVKCFDPISAQITPKSIFGVIQKTSINGSISNREISATLNRDSLSGDISIDSLSGDIN